MTVRPPLLESPTEAEGPTSPEVLFKEAHERRRRRWIRALAVLVVAAAGTGISYGAIGNGGHARASKSPAPASNSKASGNASRSSTGATLCGSGAVAVPNCLIALSFVSSKVGFGVYSGVSVTGESRPAELVSTTDGGSTWHEVGRAPVGFGRPPSTCPPSPS